MSMPEMTMRRLALIKAHFRQGQSQADGSQPLSSLAVLTFHDAVELFLRLALEHRDAVPSSRVTFMEHWSLISDALPDGQRLSQKAAMQRLNGARRELKHRGTLPAQHSVRDLSHRVREFFEQNTETVFGVQFRDISLVAFIPSEAARERLQKAHEALSEGELKQSIAESKAGYQLMFREYDSVAAEEYGYRSLVSEGFSFHRWDLVRGRSSWGRDEARDPRLDEFAREIKKRMEPLQEAVKVLALGLDYRDFLRFQRITPVIQRSVDEEVENVIWTTPTASEPSVTEAEFCIDFVVEAGLALKELREADG